MPAAPGRFSRPLATTPEVNVLVAASRGEHAQHRPARSWLEGALASNVAGTGFGLMPMVQASFLRRVSRSGSASRAL